MKSKNTAGLLAFFLGGLGVHKFYLGKNITGVFFLLFSWTWIPFIIGFIEAFYFWGMSEERFKKEYGVKGSAECPYCLNLINEGAKKCHHCNTLL